MICTQNSIFSLQSYSWNGRDDELTNAKVVVVVLGVYSVLFFLISSYHDFNNAVNVVVLPKPDNLGTIIFKYTLHSLSFTDFISDKLMVKVLSSSKGFFILAVLDFCCCCCALFVVEEDDNHG